MKERKIILINISKNDFNYSKIKKYKKKFKIIFAGENNISYDKKNVIAILAGLEKFNRQEIDKYPNLRIISRFGTGVDNIDLIHAKAKKILVLKTRHEPVLPTVELTISLILLIIRKLYFNIFNLKKKKMDSNTRAEFKFKKNRYNWFWVNWKISSKYFK